VTDEETFSATEQRMVAWVAEALDLRHGAAGDPLGAIKPLEITDGPDQVRLDLSRARLRQDRLDELLAAIRRARGRVSRARKNAANEAKEAYDRANQVNQSRRRVEFSSAKERDSDASLDSIEERRVAFQAERLESVAQECFDIINDAARQMGSLRDDLKATLRAFQFESSLER
jgi:hypothetical protein